MWNIELTRKLYAGFSTLQRKEIKDFMEIENTVQSEEEKIRPKATVRLFDLEMISRINFRNCQSRT
jgi:hypothetical protein